MRLLICLLCWILLYPNLSLAQCPSLVAGQLSGQWNTLLSNDTTPTPTYTILPSGLPNTEFLVLQYDAVASDGFGPKILLSSLDGRVSPNSLGLTTCNEIGIVPFSYDLSQLQTIVDTLYGAEYLPGTSCCAAAGQFFGGICDSMSLYGINSGADINNLNDVITLIGLIAGTNNGSTSLFNLTSSIDQLNGFMMLFGPCSGGVSEVCYAVIDSLSAMDAYVVRLPNAASNINLVQDTVVLAPNGVQQLNATYTPLSANDSIVWYLTNPSTSLSVGANGLLSASSALNDSSWVIAQTLNSCLKDSAFVRVQLATNINTQSPRTEQEISLMPNPFDQQLTLKTKISTDYLQVQVIDGQGKSIFEKKYTVLGSNTWSINTSAWPKGLYYLRIVDQYNSAVKALVKQ